MVKRKKTYEQRMVDYNRERAGKAAQGFLLGGALGNIPGALFGSWYAQKDVQEPKRLKGEVVQTKNMPKNTAVKANKKLIQRSSMASKGKAKVKKTKTVKVPGRLRKQIKQVIASQAARGTYVTIKSGFVGNITGTTALINTINGDDMAKTLPAVYYGQSTNGLPGRTFFNQLCKFSTNATTIVSQTGMNYFTPAKILDAASTLFNRKGPTDPYTLTGNLSTLSTTGVPSNTAGKLLIDLRNSYVQFTIKNVSNRVISMDIWECTPTLKFVNDNALNNMKIQTETMAQGSSNEANFQYIFNGANAGDTAMFDQNLDIFEISKKYLGLKFSWKKRSMVLAPDETCIHSITGPKGVLDFSKLLTTTANAGGTASSTIQQIDVLMKNWSVSVVMSVAGDLVLPTATSGGGRMRYAAFPDRLSAPVAVEVKESYTVVVPEVAGFINSDPDAGQTQQLNLRKHKYTVWNQCEKGDTGYSISNEVNPLADVNANQAG